MYQPSKDDGGIIGIVDGPEEGDFAFAHESTRAEEALMCAVTDTEGIESQVCLTSYLDAATGDLAWKMHEDKEMIQRRTVSMSQMTSMIRDRARNLVYEEAIAKCLENFTSKTGRPPSVLDIGSGTGLLSLISAKYGATVIGCEMFETMANIATNVVERNGLADQIQIIPCKSTQLDGSMFEQRPDILVSELLDSALLGESCQYSHAHAISQLLTPDSAVPLEDRVVPHSATMHFSLVESEAIRNMVDPSGVGLFGSEVWRDPVFAPSCVGGWPLIPVHWDILQDAGGRVLSDSNKLLDFNFCRGLMSKKDEGEAEDEDDEAEVDPVDLGVRSSHVNVTVHTDGTVNGVLLWWNLYLLSPSLDPDRSIQYSTDPSEGNTQNWQDHWVQCVFPLPTPIVCSSGDVLSVSASRDCIKVWLQVEKKENVASEEEVDSESPLNKRVRSSDYSGDETLTSDVPQQQCSCGWHVLCGAERMQVLNDLHRKDAFEQALQRVCQEIQLRSDSCGDSAVAVDVGDGSLLAIGLGKLLRGSSVEDKVRVISVEKKQFSRLFHSQLVHANDLDDNVLVWDGDDWEEVLEFCQKPVGEDEDDEVSIEPTLVSEAPVVALISECYYYQLSSLPTWQALAFWYQRTALSSRLALNASIMPCKALVMVAAICLQDLQVSHGPVCSVSGFDHSAYDEQLQEWHCHMFPYKLASYRKSLLTKPTCVAVLDYKCPVADVQTTEKLIPVDVDKITESSTCHCVAVWVDYVLHEGPEAGESEPITLQQWDGDNFPSYLATNIRFLPEPVAVHGASQLVCRAAFAAGDSDFKFEFSIHS